MTSKVVTARHLVMPKDLNPANRLFGGQMMAWIDEAAAMYAMCQAKTKYVVTAKVSEVDFNEPVEQGDFLSFEAETTRIGKSSFVVCITVYKKDYKQWEMGSYIQVARCNLTFVTINPETGKPIPHGMKLEQNEKVSVDSENNEYY